MKNVSKSVISLSLALFAISWVIFTLSLLDLTICTQFTHNSSIETASLCKILEESDKYFWIYCVSKIGGYKVFF